MADSVMVPRMTITTGDVFIPEVWTNDLLVARESKLVMSNLVERLDQDAQDGGDTLHIDQISNLEAYEKASSTSVTLQAPTETGVDLNLNRHFESSILIEDRLKLQAKRAYALLQKYSARAGYAIAKKMDSDLTGLYGSASNRVGDGNTSLTDANILLAFQYLDEADVPDEDRHFVVKPSAKTDLLNLDKFTLYHNVNTTDAIRKAAIGDIYGADTFVTNQVTRVVGSPSVDHNMLFHREAVALAVQMAPRIQFQYKQEYLGTLCTVDSLWGYAVQRADHMVDVRSAI